MEGYAPTDKGGISNFLRVNIKNNSYGTLKLYQSNLVEKIISHLGLNVSVRLKCKENLQG